MPPIMQFQEIPIGGHFEFRGRRYQKLALSMARDEDHYGNIFQAQTEVLPDPLPQRPLSASVVTPTASCGPEKVNTAAPADENRGRERW
jgi:hypothetical protein